MKESKFGHLRWTKDGGHVLCFVTYVPGLYQRADAFVHVAVAVNVADNVNLNLNVTVNGVPSAHVRTSRTFDRSVL